VRTPRRRSYWLAPPEREARDEAIRELYAMGKTRRELAKEYGVTPQRIDQIVAWMKKGR
jgi:hypothetical protein